MYNDDIPVIDKRLSYVILKIVFLNYSRWEMSVVCYQVDMHMFGLLREVIYPYCCKRLKCQKVFESGFNLFQAFCVFVLLQSYFCVNFHK